MKIGKRAVLSVKNTLIVLLVLAVLFVLTLIVVSLPLDNGYVVVILFILSLVVMITGGNFLERVTTEHHAQFREVMPLSHYDSIQDRAQKFLQLKVPLQNKKLRRLKRSNVTKYIETYAKTGNIELTEKERTRLSLVILETGISSQEPGEKSYYERERIAVLENILSEHQGQAFT